MANKGYIMFTLDNRGSSNQGWSLKTSPSADTWVLRAKNKVKVDYLKSLPPHRQQPHQPFTAGVSADHILPPHAALSEFFKVGVADGPVIDWKYERDNVWRALYGHRRQTRVMNSAT